MALLATIGLGTALPASACDVMASALNMLHEGMSYAEVVSVIGCGDGDHLVHIPGARDSYSWGGAKSFVTITFFDGKLHDWSGMPAR
jgi:hypothetical protein